MADIALCWVFRQQRGKEEQRGRGAEGRDGRPAPPRAPLLSFNRAVLFRQDLSGCNWKCESGSFGATIKLILFVKFVEFVAVFY